MVQLIHASVKGRARFKIKGLYRSESLKKHLESNFSSIQGINYFSVNSLTGNALVCFNSDKTTQAIASAIENILAEYKNQKASFIADEGLTAVKKHIEGEKSSRYNKQDPLYSSSTRPKTIISRRKLRRSIINSDDQRVEKWHLMHSQEVLDYFCIEQNVGLTSESAANNLKKYGLNVLPEAVPRSGWSIFIEQFKSLPVALLSAAAGVSIVTGGLADALVIMGVVFINSVIGYITESQSEKTIHSLKSLVRPSANVIRDGKLQEIGAEQVAPGDILVLRPGNYVAADARLLEAQNLSIDESVLTGESMPVLKNTQALIPNPLTPDISLADRLNMVYMGTLVTGGQGVAIVVATGRFTEIGKIQTLVGKAKPPDTPLERQLDTMGSQLVIISGFVCLAIFFIGLLRGYSLLEMIKTSISLAVAAVPEGLPTVATTTLALGIRKMRRHNVLIRHLDAVETLGSVQTICLDKTGTLTMNKMSVVLIYVSMKRIKVDEGNFIVMDSIVHDYTKNRMPEYLNPYQLDELLKLIHICVLCNESLISKNGGEYVVNGSPTENAFIHLALSSGVDVIMLKEKFPLVSIKHRSEKLNCMFTVHNIKMPGIEQSRSKIIAVKGSPIEVLSLCGYQMIDGKKIPLADEDRLSIEIENDKMAGEALRVLGVAYAFIDETIESCTNDLESGLNKCEDSCNNGDYPYKAEFIWLGLICIADPIRDGVKELIGKFHAAGIDTIMITGDQGPTAYAIGKELELNKGEQLEILDSSHLSDIQPDLMMAMCRRVHVFSRASPAHKLQIVQALQKVGRVVAMTGDGINDGPALKVADIGIAMGHKGTDVAREVADVVLEDDNMETMIIAISQGRTIYNNIRKSVHFLLSTNLSEIMVMFTAMAAGLGQPLSSMQLLWINLISDIAPGLALALEPPEPDVLSQPPRNPDEPIIRTSDFKRISFESAILSAGSLSAYGYGIMRYGMGQQASSMAFMSLTIGQILHAISCRSEKHNIFGREKLPSNTYLNTAITGSLALQAIAMVVPGLRSLLGIAPIGFIDGIVIGGSALVPLLINEGTKNIA